MKKLTILALLISFISISALADQRSCKLSQKSRLSDDLLRKLTVKVCPPEQTSDPDIYMAYDRKYESSTSAEFLVYEYTDKCFEKMNAELFKTKDQDPDILKLTEQLDAVLCDYPESKESVYRGTNLPDAVAEKYSTSEEISFPAFSSSSKSFRVACDFAKKGNTLFKMTSKSGRAVDKLSKHEEEEEVLFRLNTRFKVKTAVSGFQATAMSGCKGISHYYELEEIYTEEEMKPFVWPY